MGIIFILRICIMYEFSVVLALISVPIFSNQSYCNDTQLYVFIKFVNILPWRLDVALLSIPNNVIIFHRAYSCIVCYHMLLYVRLCYSASDSSF